LTVFVDESVRGYPMDENKFIPASFAGLWIKLIVFLDESIRCNQMDENMLRKSSPPPNPQPLVWLCSFWTVFSQSDPKINK